MIYCKLLGINFSYIQHRERRQQQERQQQILREVSDHLPANVWQQFSVVKGKFSRRTFVLLPPDGPWTILIYPMKHEKHENAAFIRLYGGSTEH